MHTAAGKKRVGFLKNTFSCQSKESAAGSHKNIISFFCSSHMEQQRHSEHPLNSQMTILEEERGKDKAPILLLLFCVPPLCP